MLIRGIAQRAPHQHGRAIADVGRDDIQGKVVPSEVPQHPIDGVGQVVARIDQRAIKVENEQLDTLGGYGAIDFH